MKFPVLLLSAAVQIVVAGSLYAQSRTPSLLTPEQRETEIRELRHELELISTRLSVLESQGCETSARAIDGESSKASEAPAGVASAGTLAKPEAAAPAIGSAAASPQPPQSAPESASFLAGTTLGIGFDGYYDYNFNAPIGRVNLLRAYDVTSNSFNINQVSLIVEHLPTPTERMGGRVDLQFGQATETLQGSSANEQRPQVWRNLFQAYGSYLAPIGSGLQLDFGKFASALGNEGNYTKDQIAYSRAFSFNFLPFYHMGLRANYNVNSKLNVTYWLVNGANDTEDLNGFKSQGFIFTIKPASTLSWNVNYYFGEEARDVEPTLNPGEPTSPTQAGLPTANITPTPNGREHIFDTYATWNATSRLTLVPEADFVINRTYAEQQPKRVVIGSLSAKYALPHNWNTGARFEYFDDRGGLFSGSTQALKEGTLVLDHLFTPSFLTRAEYRRDFSNQRFFLTDTPGVLVHAQTTATLGLIYWWGTKQGSW